MNAIKKFTENKSTNGKLSDIFTCISCRTQLKLSVEKALTASTTDLEFFENLRHQDKVDINMQNVFAK